MTLCPHTPPCPPAWAVDRFAARVVVAWPEQGWSLLCNAVIVFDDTGELLPDGSPIAPHCGPEPLVRVACSWPGCTPRCPACPSGCLECSGCRCDCECYEHQDAPEEITDSHVLADIDAVAATACRTCGECPGTTTTAYSSPVGAT